MTTEDRTTQQRIEAIETETKLWQESASDHPDGYNITVARDMGEALVVIKELQEEVTKWKTAHQASGEESKEIIAELEGENEKLRESRKRIFEACNSSISSNLSLLKKIRRLREEKDSYQMKWLEVSADLEKRPDPEEAIEFLKGALDD